MTMHLVNGLSTNNTKKRLSSKSKKLEASRKKHEEWLKANRVHPDQLNYSNKKSVVPMPSYSVENKHALSNKIEKTIGRRGVMDNRFNEKPEVRREIEAKATRIAPAYNKGALQYITPEADVQTLGKKV